MENQDRIQKGFDLCCNYLSYCSRTEHEIREYLNRKNYTEPETDQIITRLKTYNYINDEQFVRNAVKINFSGNRYGKRRLIEKLKQKGIAAKYLEWVDRKYPQTAEEKCAAYHFAKAQEKYINETYSKKRQKIYAYLSHRGFSTEQINDFLNQIETRSTEKRENNLKDIEKYYNKYYNMQSKKGYTGSELKQRIIKNLLSRGFNYAEIKEYLSDKI